jgi:hypothetical protein
LRRNSDPAHIPQGATSPHVHGIHTVHRCTRWCANALGYTKSACEVHAHDRAHRLPRWTRWLKRAVRSRRTQAPREQAGESSSPVARLGSRSRLGPGAGPGGPVDTGLAPGNVLIPAEPDTANGLPQDPLKPAQGQGSSSLETTKSPLSRPHRRPQGGPNRVQQRRWCARSCACTSQALFRVGRGLGRMGRGRRCLRAFRESSQALESRPGDRIRGSHGDRCQRAC